MRRATMATAWLLSEEGEVEGVALGADACTEHECGVAPLRRSMGVADRFEKGLLDRTMTMTPPLLAYAEYLTEGGEPAAVLMIGDSHQDLTSSDLPGWAQGECSFSKRLAECPDGELVCAWDRAGAALHGRGIVQVDRLAHLYRSFCTHDIAFGADLVDRDRHPNGGGLTFVRASTVSPTLRAAALAKDESHARLKIRVEALGIERELREAGKEWFALSPRWKSTPDGEDVHFWLNPMRQDDHNSGWFTVDELRQWVQGKGPVMIDKPLRALGLQHAKELEQILHRMRRHDKSVFYLSVQWKDERRDSIEIAIKRRGADTHELIELDALRAKFPAPPKAPKKRR